MDFQIHVNPGAVEGSTPYDITFMDYEDPSIILGHVDGEVLISNSVSTKNNGAQSNLTCLLYTSPSPRDRTRSRMPSSA